MDFNVINMALWLYQWFCFCPQKCYCIICIYAVHIHNSWVLNIQIANKSYMHSTSTQGVKSVVKCWHRVTRDQLPANSCQTTCLRQVTLCIWVIFLHNMHYAFLWKLSWNRPFRLKSSILTFLSPARGKYEQERLVSEKIKVKGKHRKEDTGTQVPLVFRIKKLEPDDLAFPGTWKIWKNRYIHISEKI